MYAIAENEEKGVLCKPLHDTLFSSNEEKITTENLDKTKEKGQNGPKSVPIFSKLFML